MRNTLSFFRQQDAASGGLFLLIGTAFGCASLHHELGSSQRPGPGYFPLVLSVLLLLVGSALLWRTWRKQTPTTHHTAPLARRALVAVVCAVLLFGLLLPRLGLFITVPLVLAVADMAAGKFELRRWLISAMVLTLFSWLVFNLGLSLNLPVSPTLPHF